MKWPYLVNHFLFDVFRWQPWQVSSQKENCQQLYHFPQFQGFGQYVHHG
jgi:hypothetical protein